MNSLLNAMKNDSNYTYTENGAITHVTTNSALLDMFGMGGSMRNRSDEDIIFMFKKAYEENPEYALKCLFYLRDVRGGQGERRFFRTVIKWLAHKDKNAVLRNLEAIPEMGRWDDLYALVGTPVEKEVFYLINKQLLLDVESKTPSLLAKWLKSENTSSPASKMLGRKTREALGMNSKQYRKMLSMLRGRIKIVETLMSQNRWDEIEFDKIPSKAGLIYKNVFATKDVTKARYAAFMANKETKVNAAVLNPVDIAKQIFSKYNPSKVERLAWDKYWANLKDYYNGREERGIAVVDVSGSMDGTPLYAAVSMGAYIAERGKGPFQNHFITFSDQPELVKFEGIDLYDKFRRAENANWRNSTNIEAVFDLLLSTAIKNHVSQDEMPETLYIFSDMEFNGCMVDNTIVRNVWGRLEHKMLRDSAAVNTLIEKKMREWKAYGYKAPNVIFWNLDARQDNIPAIGDGFFYVSGNSMNVIESILSRTPPKTAYQLMMDVLTRDRYKNIH